MAESYATVEDLTGFLAEGAVVNDGTRMLARASELLDGSVLAPFALGDDGLPSDTDVAAAMRDACCAQVEQWLEVGEENDIDGLAGSQIAVTGYSGPRAPRLAPRAFRILHTAGLMTSSTTADQFFGVFT